MSNELTVINNDIFALPPEAVGFDTTVFDIRPTQLVFIQNTTRDQMGARPGQFVDKKSRQAFDKMVIVPLNIRYAGRSYFQKDVFGEGIEPLCKSLDGQTPIEDAKAPQARFCGSCPHSKWVGKKNPPACKDQYLFTFLDKETGFPYFMNVKGASIKPVADFFETIARYKKLQAAQGIKLMSHDFFVTMSAARIVNSAGVFFKLTFESLSRVAQIGTYNEQFMKYVFKRSSQLAEDMAAGDSEAAADSAVEGAIDTTAEEI